LTKASEVAADMAVTIESEEKAIRLIKVLVDFMLVLVALMFAWRNLCLIVQIVMK